MFSDEEYMETGESTVIRDQDTTNPVAVRFDHVDKTYKLYKSDKQRLAGIFSKRVPCELVHANNDLSFTVGRGEGLALLGDNGSGKSTALKMITGVCFPTSGTIEVHGRIAALLELSAGFDMRLTGMENLKMRCEIWGLSKEEAEEYIPEMVEFSEVGTYIDQPMRTYSSGMRARLGFAFASSIRPDILVIDEALSVGDRKFSKKCRVRVNKIMSEENVTVLFVTHSTAQAQEFCQRGIVLEHGCAMFSGDIDEAVAYYTDGEEGVAALAPRKAAEAAEAAAAVQKNEAAGRSEAAEAAAQVQSEAAVADAATAAQPDAASEVDAAMAEVVEAASAEASVPDEVEGRVIEGQAPTEAAPVPDQVDAQIQLDAGTDVTIPLNIPSEVQSGAVDPAAAPSASEQVAVPEETEPVQAPISVQTELSGGRRSGKHSAGKSSRGDPSNRKNGSSGAHFK